GRPAGRAPSRWRSTSDRSATAPTETPARSRRPPPRRRRSPAPPASAATAPSSVAPEPELDGQQRGLGPVVDVQLTEDAGDVVLHRLLADEQALADFAIRLAGRQELEDLLLARRQIGELLAVALLDPLALELAQHARSDVRGQDRLAAGRSLDRGADLVGTDVLEQVADRARLERREHPLRVRVGGEHH